jgi:hypothetical protein
MSKISPFSWFDTEAEAAGELLRVDFQGLQDRDDLALRRRGSRPERQRDDGELSARRAGIHRSERRAAIQVHRPCRVGQCPSTICYCRRKRSRASAAISTAGSVPRSRTGVRISERSRKGPGATRPCTGGAATGGGSGSCLISS